MKKSNFLSGLLMIFISLNLLSCSNDDISSSSENLTTGGEQQVQMLSRANVDVKGEIIKIANEFSADVKIVGDEISPETSIKMSLDEFKSLLQDDSKNREIEITVEPVEDNTTITGTGCADGIYFASVGAGFGNLDFYVQVTNGKISSVSSGMSGFTPGVSYAQNYYMAGSNYAMVGGTFNYNLFVEGIGTIYRSSVTFRINLPC